MDAKLRLRLRVLIPIVENAIQGSAFRPGHILTRAPGQTVEIGNTYAEGRLILGDALTLADEARNPSRPSTWRPSPARGAHRARPRSAAALRHDDTLGGRSRRRPASPPTIRLALPAPAPYETMLSSRIAMLTHISSGAFAGSVTAALLSLKRFVRHAKAWRAFHTHGWAPRRAGRPALRLHRPGHPRRLWRAAPPLWLSPGLRHFGRADSSPPPPALWSCPISEQQRRGGEADDDEDQRCSAGERLVLLDEGAGDRPKKIRTAAGHEIAQAAPDDAVEDEGPQIEARRRRW